MPYISVAAFFLLNGLALGSACLLVAKFFRPAARVDLLISVSVLYYAQIVATELFLGMCGRLFLLPLAGVNAAVFLAVFWASRKKPTRVALTSAPASPGQAVPGTAVRFLLCSVAGFYAVKFCINLVNPPFGWDSLNYHFTFPVEWLKTGTLDNPPVVFDDPSPTYYPINGSLIYLWFMLPFKSVFLADLAQAPFFILAFFSLYGISRKLGLGTEQACLACALFLLIPNVCKHLEVAYVDMMLAGLFLASLNALLLLGRDFSWKNSLLFGLSLGLLMGLKTIALFYAALLLAPFLFLAARGPRRLHIAFCCIVVALLLGGFAYARNALVTGNPLYPLRLSIAGREVFKGVMDASVYRAHFKPGDYSLAKLLFHEGLGPQTLFFILPGALLALPLSLVRGRLKIEPLAVFVFILPVTLYLVYRYLIPLPNARYLYPLLGVGMAVGFISYKAAGAGIRLVRWLAVLCALVSFFELSKRAELAVSLVLVFLLFFLSGYLLQYLGKPKVFVSPLFAGASFLVAATLLAFLQKDYAANEFKRYIRMERYSGFWPDATRAWLWLNNATSGENIAYAGRPVPFPLYGSGFKNNVYYVSVNARDPARLHYFKGSDYRWGYDFIGVHRSFEQPKNYRANADYAAWLVNLLRRDTDYLFVYSLHQTEQVMFPLEDEWAVAHPERFAVAFANATVHVYKVIKEKS